MVVKDRRMFPTVLSGRRVGAVLCVVVVGLLQLSMVSTARNSGRHGRRSPSGCEDIQVPMCKGLVGYGRTKLPNRFGHRSQAAIYWALQPWWPFMDAGCSDNLRNFLCGLYLPRCMGDDAEPQYPCAETCKKAKVRCKRQMRVQNMPWSRSFRCRTLLPKKSKKCIKPVREKKKDKYHQYTLCDENPLSLCQGIPFTQGSLPNMFLQADTKQIDKEMQQFLPLLHSGCSKKLRFFMCGAYMPYCVPATHVEVMERGGSDDQPQTVIQAFPDVPFVVPCRELCQEVYDQCSGEYEQRTHGLPWPGKFHCHRYPSYVDRYGISKADSNPNGTSQGRQEGSTVPCTMLPYNYEGN